MSAAEKLGLAISAARLGCAAKAAHAFWFDDSAASAAEFWLAAANACGLAIIAEKALYVQTKEKPQVKEGKAKTTEFDYPGYRYIGWNFKREIFKEKAVRTALAHAIPVQKIIDKVLYGLGTRLSGPFSPTSPSSDASLPLIPFDPDKARSECHATIK